MDTPSASSTPPLPNPKQRRAWAIAWGGLVVGILGGLALLILPTLISSRIQAFAREAGLRDLTLAIDRISPWQATAGDLQIGTAPELQLDRLQLAYRPLGLWRRTIDHIRLSGLRLKLQRRQDHWIIAGLPPSWFAPSAARQPPAGPAAPLPWRVARIEIVHAQLEILDPNRRLVVPFSLELRAETDDPQHYRGRLAAQPLDQALQVTIDAELNHRRLALSLEAAGLDIGRLAAAGLPVDRGVLDARVDFSLRAGLEWTPQLRLTAAEGILRLAKPLSFRSADGRNWRAGPATSRTDAQLTFALTGQDAWQWHMDGLDLLEPLPMRLAEGQGQMARAGGSLAGSARLVLEALPETVIAPAGLPPLMAQGRLPLEAQWRWIDPGQWSLTVSGTGSRWTVARADTRQTPQTSDRLDFKPHLKLQAEAGRDGIDVDLQASLQAIEGRLASDRLRVGALTSRSTARLSDGALEGRSMLQLSEGRFDNPQITGRLPQLDIQGDWRQTAQSMNFKGRLSLKRAAAHLLAADLQLNGIQLTLPLTWPLSEAAPGALRAVGANFKDRDLGGLEGSVRLQPAGVAFDLAHVSRLVSGARLTLQGALTAAHGAQPPELEIAYRLERPLTAQDQDLAQLLPAAQGVRVNGQLSAEGLARYRNGRSWADLRGELRQGHVLLPDGKGGITGLTATLYIPDLTTLRSQPRQRLQFERAFLSDIAITDGKIDFQTEPGGVLFLEQSRFRWCEGTVLLPATRIVPGVNEYDVSLLCDRLKLAPLLQQLGAAQAEGGGSVSGRIPLDIRQGRVFIDNGFLYSSPGEGGTIRLRGTDLLTAGIPVNTPQYIQLELARQALKDYDYHWVKLGLATEAEGDILRLTLQLDGKPSQPLPFKYDTEAGGFVPAAPDEKGSTFQGISLDVNFSLPLNRLLQYKNLLKLLD